MLATVAVNAEVVLNTIVPDVEERFTVNEEVVTILLLISSATRVTAVEETPAVAVCAEVVMTSLFTVPELIVSD